MFGIYFFSIEFCQLKNSCVLAEKTIQPFIIPEKYFSTVCSLAAPTSIVSFQYSVNH